MNHWITLAKTIPKGKFPIEIIPCTTRLGTELTELRIPLLNFVLEYTCFVRGLTDPV